MDDWFWLDTRKFILAYANKQLNLGSSLESVSISSQMLSITVQREKQGYPKY